MPLAPFLPILYRVLKPTFPACLWAGSLSSPAIALTFDDGPHPEYTLRLLDVLDQYSIKASFFWLGQCVDHNSSVAQAVYQKGHWVGLHGYTHRSFARLSPDELRHSLERTQDAIAHACRLNSSYARRHIRDVRPPNGLFTPRTLTNLQDWGYRPVMWSVVPEDWVRPGVGIVVQRVLDQTQNGSLIVLHDGHFGGADVVQTVAQLIPALLKQGYQFITIDQLWQQHPWGNSIAG